MRRITGLCRCSALFAMMLVCSGPAFAATQPAAKNFKHVLLLSVDGMHAADLAFYVHNYPHSALAKLAAHGVTYTNASTPWPSDSFPGLLAMTTGGSPASTGVFYDNSYDRELSPPGSDCSSRGSVVLYNEAIDARHVPTQSGAAAIDPAKLPRDPARHCSPVYPHDYLRVNTVFDVVRNHGGVTAWADKHPAYEILGGPPGNGVTELYTPEIGENAEGKSRTVAGGITGSLAWTIHYDGIKVDALLNEIHGLDYSGQHRSAVPALFGMNFQALNVAQKLPDGGYHAYGTEPSAEVLAALRSVDNALGRIVAALQAANLQQSTIIVVSAKSGNSPMNRHQLRIINNKAIPALLNKHATDAVLHVTADDIMLIWLKQPTAATHARAILMEHAEQLGIAKIYANQSLLDLYGLRHADSRTPDLIVQPQAGVIYTHPGAGKIAEHGGFDRDDTHVALLVSTLDSHSRGLRLSVPVSTMQIAPSILKALGLEPTQLQAVRREHTPLLPVLP